MVDLLRSLKKVSLRFGTHDECDHCFIKVCGKVP